MKTIAVIGGGIVGLATAWKLSQRFPESEITVFEKENKVGAHQSGNNSGVLHCGLYYRPGSFKAKMAVGGIRQMVSFCEQYEIAHEVCGKLVVATNEVEQERLEGLRERGTANGLENIRYLSGEEMREREPNVGGVAALEVPQEGIVDYPAVCKKLSSLIEKSGGRILTGTEVTGMTRKHGKWEIRTSQDNFAFDFAVNCGGLHSDRICRIAGIKPRAKIVPFRGEYYKLKESSSHLVNHLIYPVPDPAFPFLGVHFTRLIHGGIEAGPNAVLAFAREGYTMWNVNPRDLAESLVFPGLWRFAAQYKSMCMEELAQSFSRKKFCKSLQKLVPAVTPDDLEAGGAGVRAQAMDPGGKLVEDFLFEESEGLLNVLNAPSPAATASLAIADEIVSRVSAA